MLILVLHLDLKSKQEDITSAFLHADMEEEEIFLFEYLRQFKIQGKSWGSKR